MSSLSEWINDVTEPVCNDCKHYGGGRSCTAFDIIPKQIMTGKNRHKKPFKSQKNNIVFEEKEK